MLASIFFAAIYIGIFVLKPYDPELKDEKELLLRRSSIISDDEAQSSWYSMVQMAFLAIIYCIIQAAWFNSNKVLMQLSWPSPNNEEVFEVQDMCTWYLLPTSWHL